MTEKNNGNNLVIQGRIIWTLGSNMFAGKQKTDMNTKQPVIGVDGNPVTEYGFGLAIPKIDPRTGQPTEEYQKVWQALHTEAFKLYPSGQLPPNFAMKYKDGDSVDHNGKPFADREGYANHLVLSCTTRLVIKYFIFQDGNNVMVNDGIKCGDYVNVQLNIKAHPAQGTGRAGLYLNPGAVQFIQAGKEIINAPSGDQLFGQDIPSYNGEVVAPVAAPMPGATTLPPHPGNAPAPMAAPAPHYGVLPPTHQPAPVANPSVPTVPMPGANVTPPVGAPVHPGNVAPVGAPPAPPFNQPAPAPAGVVAPPVMPGMPGQP